ncbi:MAG TPA: cupin domain-containing protein [Acetivibrio clariflavus]|nr:cupin domain-containing protein [Acetivibrio clariflavus]
MIKRADEMVKEIKEQMRGGKGSVEILHIFKQEELKGKARLCAKITINPGCSIGLHQHDNEEEIFYVIKGKGTVNDNGTLSEVKEGDAIITGNGASHAVENTGGEPLELMAIILLY